MRKVVVALVVLLGLGGRSRRRSRQARVIDEPVTRTVIVGREYFFELGPFHTSFRVPEDLQAWAIFDRLRGLIGIVAILGLAYAFSTNRRAISRRVLFWGLLLQWAFALLVLRVPAGERVLERAGDVVKGVLDCALEGAGVRLRREARRPGGPAGFVFAFRVLPTVIFVAALFAVLYHLGVMQWVVRGFACVMARLMGTSGAESLNVAASLFLGQTEAPLTIRPYLPRLTQLGAADGDDLGHGARLGRGDGGLLRLRGRAAAHPDGRDHDRAGGDPAVEDAGPRDRQARDPGARPRRRRCGPTPTCSTPPRAGPATGCTWP